MHFELHSEFWSRCEMTVYAVSVATVCFVSVMSCVMLGPTLTCMQSSLQIPGRFFSTAIINWVYLSQCVPVVGVYLAEFEIFVQCVFIPQEWAPRTPCTGTEYMVLYSL